MALLEFTSLAFENFKTFRGKHLLFLDDDPGLYQVAGKNKLDPELGSNGAGKSSIWDALLWVLFGKTDRDNRPGKAVLPWSKRKGFTIVSLKLERDGVPCWITRALNPNSCTIIKNGLKSKRKEVSNQEIVELIGMSEEMFRRTVLLGQTTTLFLSLRPEPQAQMFNEALGLDLWLRSSWVAGESARNMRGALTKLQMDRRHLEEFIEQIDEDRKQKRGEIKQERREQSVRRADISRKIKNLIKRRKIARQAIGEKPKLPTKETDQIQVILDNLDAEPGALEKAKYQTARSFGPQKKCRTCQQSLPRPELTEALTRMENKSAKRVKSLRDDMRQLEERRRSSDRKYQQALDEWRLRQNAASQIDIAIRQLEDDMKHAEKPVESLVAEYNRIMVRKAAQSEQLEKIDKNLVSIERTAKQCEFWQKAFKEIRLSIIDDVLGELELASNRHAELLGLRDWEIKFQTERETKSGSISYVFTVLLYPPGQDEPVKWESYSGGESQRLQLAVAFGLSEVLLARAGVDVNLEILDEPTRGLSPDGVSDLLEHLADRAREAKRAIFFVDQHVLDKGAFDGTILVEKGKHGSTLRWT